MSNPAAGPPPRPRAGPRQASARQVLIATSTIAVALVVLAAACLGVAVARYLARPAVHVETVSPAVARAEAASRRLAAIWVTQEVSHAVVVACDAQLCAALKADGFPPRNLLVLGQAATYPLSSAVVVVTQAIRDLFGSSFTSNYAPAVLAAFGSAEADITVRVIARGGAAAYWAQLGADLKARKSAGSDLAQTSGITTSAEAKKQLEAGQPDSRLLLAIAALASSEPVDILGFGIIGPEADPAIPLRFADLAESDPAARTASPAYVRALRAVLGAVSAQFRPTVVTVNLPDGQRVLRIEVTAPSPLTLLGPSTLN
jgi:predicted pyridoxine 5'-phosphate oxidase superfamily flavin-nucleotide-binding protein